MAKYFFTGGTMPSADLLHHFQDDLTLQQQWAINGTHYSRTLEDWLKRQDKQRATIMPIMEVRFSLVFLSVIGFLSCLSAPLPIDNRWMHEWCSSGASC